MLLADLALKEACPANRFLEEMTETVPWPLFEAELKAKIQHKRGGRRPFCRLLLFKMHLLQVWHGLSDEQTEFQCNDRLSFRTFLNVGIKAKIPDATTLENFRKELRETGLDTGLMAKLDDYFKEQGLLLKEGNMVDASFIRANSKPKKTPEKQSDLDAEWGHKGFGYSATVNADRKTKLIRRVNTTSERPHDSKQLSPVLMGDETELFGDSGYLPNRQALEKQGITTHIVKKRARGKKGEAPPALNLRDQYRNKLYAKLRSPVEHVFACWKTVFKLTRAWYRGLERVNQQVQSLALAYNLRRYGYLCRSQCV